MVVDLFNMSIKRPPVVSWPLWTEKNY